MEYPSCHIRGHTGSERQISQTLPGQNEPLSPLPWRTCTLTQITHIFSLKISQPGVQASSGDAELAYQGMLRHHEINRIGYRDTSLVLTHLWNSQIATFMTFPPTLSSKCTVSGPEIHLETTIYILREPDMVAQWRQNSKLTTWEHQIQLWRSFP